MNYKLLVKSIVFITFVWSYIFSYSHSFKESSIRVEIDPNERKEICINNSSSVHDLWNNRYLHIDSSDKSYKLYSKRTIFFEILNNKHVEDKIQFHNKKDPYSVDIRMYFSRCYIIENTSTENNPIQISAFTYRRFCTWNATVMMVIITIGLFNTKKIINEIVFFGLSFVAFFVSFASAITYLPQMLLTLPGMKVIGESLGYAVSFIAFYSIFVTSIFSFILRISLNYYHFSYLYLHSIPRIVSTIGPYVCHYQEWVIGFYIAIALFIIPLNREWLWFVSILGILLVVLLWSYGAEMVKAYLMGGLIISVILVTVVFVLWILGSKQVFPQQGSDDKKRE